LNTPHPVYNPNYKLIDKKVLVPTLGNNSNHHNKQSSKNFPSLLSPRNETESPSQNSPKEQQPPELLNIEKLSMKKKLRKLDHMISVKGNELTSKLGPDGKPYVEVDLDDIELAKEKEFIMRMLQKK
jgi:hypothetical protein